jgi:DNA-binding transcriptional regulator YiaG
MAATTARHKRGATVYPPLQSNLFQGIDSYPPTSTEVDAELSANEIAKMRAASGLTLKDFAAWLGIKVSTYTQWEYGQTKPSGPALSLLLICKARPDVVHEVLGSARGRAAALRVRARSVKNSVKVPVPEKADGDIRDVNSKS